MAQTIPPDNIQPGDPQHITHHNNIADMLTLLTGTGGAGYSVLNATFAGGADPLGSADSTAAFQAAITAATAARSEVTIPPGTYKLLGTVNFTGPVKIRGLGAALSFLSGSVPAVTLNGPTGASHMFAFPWQGALWGGLEISGIGINYTGTGNVFHQCNITDSAFRDMTIVLTAPGSAAMYLDGANSLLNVMHERCNITTTHAARTSPMISIISSASGAISNNTFLKCKFTNAGMDASQYMVYFACTAAGNGFHYADNFRECWFEFPFGGCYKSLSGQNIVIDGCMVWDCFSGQDGLATTVAAGSNGGTISGIAAWATPSAGVLAVASTAGYPTTGRLHVAASGPTTALITYTGISGNTFTGCAYVSGSPAGTVATGGAVTLTPVVKNSLYYIGAYAGNSGQQGTLITGSGRNRNGPDGAASWDVECDAASSQVQVQGYAVKPDSSSTATNAFFNFHGCNDVLLLNNVSPQGSAVNGNSTTVVTNPSPTQLAISQGVITPPDLSPTGFIPSDLSYLAWTFDPAMCNVGATGPVSGTIQLARINIWQTAVVTNIVTFISTGGGTLTSGQNLLALYKTDGTRIGVTADQSAAWASAGVKTAALTGGPFTLTPGIYWVGLLSVGTTTPLFGRLQNLNAAITNAGAGATSNFRCATNLTGQTALPSPLVPASNVAGQVIICAALS